MLLYLLTDFHFIPSMPPHGEAGPLGRAYSRHGQTTAWGTPGHPWLTVYSNLDSQCLHVMKNSEDISALSFPTWELLSYETEKQTSIPPRLVPSLFQLYSHWYFPPPRFSYRCLCIVYNSCLLGVISIPVMSVFPATGCRAGQWDQTSNRWLWSSRLSASNGPLDGWRQEECVEGDLSRTVRWTTDRPQRLTAWCELDVIETDWSEAESGLKIPSALERFVPVKLTRTNWLITGNWTHKRTIQLQLSLTGTINWTELCKVDQLDIWPVHFFPKQ